MCSVGSTMLLQLCASFHNHQWIQTRVSPETPNLGQNRLFFLPRVTLKFDGWPWKIIWHSFYATASLVYHFVDICEFKLELRSGNTQTGTKFVLTFVTLTFDLWSWSFAWASLLSMVITPESFMMIRWQEHCEKGVTDGRTDRRTEVLLQLIGRT